jgi:hypothetical protein
VATKSKARVLDDEFQADLAQPAECRGQLEEQVAMLCDDARLAPDGVRGRRASRVAARWALNQVRMALLGRLVSHRMQDDGGKVWRGVSLADLDDVLGKPDEGPAPLPRADTHST